MNLLLLPNIACHCQTYQLDSTHHKTALCHIQQVIKPKLGDTLKVGILNGAMGTAVVQKLTDTHLTLTDIHCNTPAPDKLDLTIILALPRPKVLRRLMIDMTAFGVAHIILINSYRTDKSYWQSPMLARINEFLLEGLQQAKDTVLPQVTLAKRFKPFVQDNLPALLDSEFEDKSAGKHGVVTHPYASVAFSDYQNVAGLPQVLAVGAEGGWIDFEIELFAEQGMQIASFGNRILRTEAVINALCGRYL